MENMARFMAAQNFKDPEIYCDYKEPLNKSLQ